MNTKLYTQEPTKSQILHRLKIAKGHIERVIEMVENDKYCIDIIHQSQAIQAALRETDKVILENHLQCCVLDGVKEGKANERKLINELMSIFQKLQTS
jgi:DNA-binding FrmR family transcriptional regulator